MQPVPERRGHQNLQLPCDLFSRYTTRPPISAKNYLSDRNRTGGGV